MNQNILLAISCISMMIIMLVIKSYDIASSVNNDLNSFVINGSKNIIFAVIFIMFGISMFLLSNKYGPIAIVAGVLECLLGVLAVFSIPLPVVVLLNLIGCRISELILFYKAYASLSKDKSAAIA